MINNSAASKSSARCGTCLASNVLLRKLPIKLPRPSAIPL
ncbi:Uncharacterised protein [Vibrio cholerae]|nr:Uncharacterised protein [Vibrio cholerae]